MTKKKAKRIQREPTEKQLAARRAAGERLRAMHAAKRAALKPEDQPAEETPVPDDRVNSDKSCIFCGAFTTWTRAVNLQTIYICEEHYYSESTGKIAQKMKELNYATS